MTDADPGEIAPRRGGEADYCALFDAIDDGFAVIELIADADGRTVDVLHVHANPAYERHTGIQGVVGKRASDVGLERGAWYDAYTEVARTGTAARIEAHIATINRWFSAHVSRVGGGDSRTLAVVFHEITDRRRAETALRESEARYRLLFEGIDEGFCLCERVPGEPVDYRYLTVNPAFERQSGLRDAVGKTMRELVPMVEESIMERYRQAEESGESARFESHVAQLDRWFKIEVTPGDVPGRIAILFRDITMRQQAAAVLRDSEERQKFLLALSDALSPLTDTADIMAAASDLTGRHLKLDRCGYGEVDPDHEHVVFPGWYRAPGIPAFPDHINLDAFSKDYTAVIGRGETLVVDDVRVDARIGGAAHKEPFVAAQTIAFVAVPLLRGGRLVGILSAHQAEPRTWTRAEVVLLEEVLGRTAAAVERARIEVALRDSEEKYRTIFESIDEGFALIEVILDDAGEPVDLLHLETNPAYERHTGLRNVVDRRAHELAPEFDDTALHFYGEVARTGEAASTEYYVAEPVDRWFNVHASRVGDQRSRKVAVVFNDITDRRRADAVLRDSAERQAFLLKLGDALRAEDGIDAVGNLAVRMLAEHLRLDRVYLVTLNPDNDIVTIDYDVCGADLPPLLGTYRSSDFPSAIKEIFEHTIAYEDVRTDPRLTDLDRQSLAGLGAVGFAATSIRRHRTMTWAAGFVSAQPRHWTPWDIALLEDATERVWAAIARARAEAALRDTQEQQRLMLPLVPVLLWSADPAGRETTLNERWTEYTGQTEAETQDFGWLDAIHSDDLPATQAAFEHAFATGEPIEREHRIHLAGDGYRWHLVRHVPVRDDRGEIVRWFGAAIDIDDLRRLQERQEVLVAELQHRVRNILTVVRSVFSRTAMTSDDPEEMADHFRGRLDALARTQVVMTRNAEGSADLENLIRDELLSVGVSDGPHVTIDGPDVMLPARAVESIGLAIHELTTNALKYGALKVPGATLAIHWTTNAGYGGERRLTLTWREQGVPAVAVQPTRHGFGSELITEALPYRLGAETKLEFLGGGIRCTIDVPLSVSDGAAGVV